MSLSPLQQEVLFGSLLGDGHLEGYRTKSYRYIVVQSTQKPLSIRWLAHVFQNYISAPLTLREYPTRNGVGSTYRLTTRRHPDFLEIAHSFYDGSSKRVPQHLFQWITPRALAVWYMDDGSIKSRASKGVYFNTQCFPFSDVSALCDVLEERYDLLAWPRQDGKGYRIYVSGRCYEHLSTLIIPYLTADMIYKWPCPRVTHLPKEYRKRAKVSSHRTEPCRRA